MGVKYSLNQIRVGKLWVGMEFIFESQIDYNSRR